MKINLELYVEKYAWIPNVVLLILLSLGLAKTTNTWVRSAYASSGSARVEQWTLPPIAEAPQASYGVDLKKIEERNLFQAKVREEVTAEEKIVETPLNLCVQGIVVGPKWKFATVQNIEAKQIKVYGIGDSISPGANVSDILSDRIVVSRSGGRHEEIEIDYGPQRCSPGAARPKPSGSRRPPKPGLPGAAPPPGGEGIQAVSETEFVIDRKEFEAQLNNLNDLVTQARMVPNFTPDRQVDGYRIFQIVPGSVFQKLGLRNGDVLELVNGIKLDDPTRGLEAFQALKSQARFTIDLKRLNQKVTLKYEVR